MRQGQEQEKKIILTDDIEGMRISLVDIKLPKPHTIFKIDYSSLEPVLFTRRIGFVKADAIAMDVKEMDSKFISRITYVMQKGEDSEVIEVFTLRRYHGEKLQKRIFAYFLKNMEKRDVRLVKLQGNNDNFAKKFYFNMGFSPLNGNPDRLGLYLENRQWKKYLKEEIEKNEKQISRAGIERNLYIHPSRKKRGPISLLKRQEEHRWIKRN